VSLLFVAVLVFAFKKLVDAMSLPYPAALKTMRPSDATKRVEKRVFGFMLDNWASDESWALTGSKLPRTNWESFMPLPATAKVVFVGFSLLARFCLCFVGRLVTFASSSRTCGR